MTAKNIYFKNNLLPLLCFAGVSFRLVSNSKDYFRQYLFQKLKFSMHTNHGRDLLGRAGPLPGEGAEQNEAIGAKPGGLQSVLKTRLPCDEIVQFSVRGRERKKYLFEPQVREVRFSDLSDFFFSVFRSEKYLTEAEKRRTKINSCEVCKPEANF